MNQHLYIRSLWLGAILVTAPASLLSQGTHNLAGDDATYFEFGTVASLGERSVVIQSLDGQRSKALQQNFALTQDTRADLVHVGDAVEVIYTDAGGTLTLHRLLTLNSGIPKAGPPLVKRHDVSVSSSAPANHAAPRTHAPADALQKASTVQATRLARAETPVRLGVNNAPMPAAVIPVPLGGSASPRAVIPIAVTHEMPSEECNRSSADWPERPLRIAVIDFRYPTEKEEAHDIGRTGGGSGTAVADLVFARLNTIQTGFAIDRGDRRRLDRSDFAGAARLGRQLGVDAVLAGTFAPVEDATLDEYGSSKPRSYELHAGLVDTCTGQLLMKLSSETCAASATLPRPSSCVAAISAKEAENPEAHKLAFAAPIDALLSPLELNGTPSMPVSMGIVTAAERNTTTLHLPPGANLKQGDQVAIHASRLTKNPSTYTLQDLHDEEIGRVSIERMQGSVATGTFTGDVLPKPGDTVKLISKN